jgi:hypothetical protein
MRAGVVQLISCLNVKRAAPAKSLDVIPPIETMRGGPLETHWWRGNKDIAMAKFGERSVMKAELGKRKPLCASP